MLSVDIADEMCPLSATNTIILLTLGIMLLFWTGATIYGGGRSHVQTKPAPPDGMQISDLSYTSTFIFDVLVVACLRSGRDSQEYNWTILHYIQATTVASIYFVFLPRHQRSWCHAFRVLTSVQFLQLCVSLLHQGIDGVFLSISVVRIILLLTRLGHSLAMVAWHGPTLDQAQWLLSTFVDNFRSYGIMGSPQTVFVSWGLFELLFPGFCYWAHTNFGETQLDVPLTAYQSYQGITFDFAIACVDVLSSDLHACIIHNLLALHNIFFDLSDHSRFLMICHAEIPFLHYYVTYIFVLGAISSNMRVHKSSKQSPLL